MKPFSLSRIVMPCLSLAMAHQAMAAQTEERKPNILFILTDDLQATSINSWGNPDVKTPAIDKITEDGVAFINTYTNGALCGALSMPSRAMLMTGRGVYKIQSDGMKIPKAHTTFPEQLRNNGYRTFATGKWHSDKKSFNRSFAEGENIFFGGMHPYETNGHCAARLFHYDPSGKYQKGDQYIAGEFSSKMYADAAIDFLKSRRDSVAPFMAYVAFTSPHDPRNQLPSYGQRYKPEAVTLPGNYMAEHPFDNGEMTVRDETLLPVPRTEAMVQKELADYYGMVSEVDVQIGRVMAALKANGLADNTIVVFASDNGLAVGRHGLMGKQSLYDHSISVPMVIVDPRNKSRRGAKSEALCYLYDLAPTLCEMVGVPVAESMLGKSLVPVLNGAEKGAREDLFLGYSNIHRAIVNDRYKYIIYRVDGKITEQLFDLKNDPLETHDLADQNPRIAKKLNRLLAKRMKEEGDFCDLDNPNWWDDGHKIKFDELKSLFIFE